MGKIEGLVIRRLRRAGLTVEGGNQGDLLVSVMGGAPARLALETRHRFSEEHLDDLQQINRTSNVPVVLATQSLSARRRDQLTRLNLSWIEYETGVVHLRAPGLAVDLPEDPVLAQPAPNAPPVPDLAGKAGVIVEALVDLAQHHEVITQPQVIALAHATPAWTSRVFKSLVTVGAMDVVGAGPRKRWRPDLPALLDLWVAAQGGDPRATGLYVHARSHEALLAKLAALDPRELPYAVGGAVAADIYAPTLTSRPVPDVWIQAAVPPEDFAAALGGQVVPSGANLFAKQAADDPALRLARPLMVWHGASKGRATDSIMLVSPGRAYVEAARAAGRSPEVGDSLRRALLQKAREARVKKPS